MNRFAKATKLKLRFASPSGSLSVEDLWDLPLQSQAGQLSLDQIAINLNKWLKENTEDSFVKPKTVSNTETMLRFEIVKEIIEVRMAENEARLMASANRAKKEKLLGIIAAKEDAALSDMDLDELRKQVAEL